MIDIVFFDVGETLLRPYPTFHELFARLCTEAGYGVDAAEVGRVQQRLAPHLVELAEESGVQDPSLDAEASSTYWSYLYRRLLQEVGVEDEALVDRMYSTFSSSASYKLFDDVLPALGSLKGDLRLGIISNFERWLEEMLVELEVGALFEVSVISGAEGVEKPDPRIYELALERAGVDPARSVHVGDSPDMDVVPASQVGMHTILLDRYDRYPEAPGPRVASLGDVAEVVRSL